MVAAVGCCEATNPNLVGIVADPSTPCESGARSRPAPGAEWDRRTTLKSLAAAAGVIAISGCDTAPEDGAVRLRLAFCGQLLCVVPYEVARVRGHFAAEGLAVELVYTRGGNAAMQALVGGAVEYAGTSFDVALQAAANGAAIRRVASTGRLPLFALATAPGTAGAIDAPAALAGRTIGISALGNADHALLLFLLERAGVDAGTVRFAAIGTNVFDALRLAQVDAAMLQEPALTLIVEAGGRELANFMELEEARRHLGGTYEFMGVSVRAEERDARVPEIRRLAAALARGLDDTRSLPPAEVVAALPDALVAGGDVARLERVIDRYRRSLYPERVALDLEAAARVMQAQEVAGLLQPGEVDLDRLLDPAALDGQESAP
ncbi:MAG: ABC transporter substrate-binding protein [Acidobacteria bacterium]|nr:ABC transporter substrate-binding protein [Acidobacteriota bacterium]